MTTKPQSTTEPTAPETIAVRICRCGAIETGTNACAYCGAGWAQVKVPLTTFYRTPTASAAPVVDEPQKMINFLTVLEHQTHRNHEYHPVQCGECLLTETIANRIREQLGLSQRTAAATAAPMEQPGTLMQAISFCNHLAEHVTQELTEQSDNPQRDILNYEDYRKGQIQAAVEIRDRLQQLVSNADEGTR